MNSSAPVDDTSPELVAGNVSPDHVVSNTSSPEPVAGNTSPDPVVDNASFDPVDESGSVAQDDVSPVDIEPLEVQLSGGLTESDGGTLVDPVSVIISSPAASDTLASDAIGRTRFTDHEITVNEPE